jgi:Domain of unknown function (DUF4383)
MTTQRSSRLKRPHFTLLAVQIAAILVASVLLALGVLGFVPGVTTHLETMDSIGKQSGAALFGVFQVSLAHNLFHIAMGVAGLALARTYARSRAYLLVGGILFLGLWLYGLLTGPGHRIDIMPMNSADTWLHFGFGVAMVILALTLAGARVPTGARGEELPTEMPDD